MGVVVLDLSQAVILQLLSKTRSKFNSVDQKYISSNQKKNILTQELTQSRVFVYFLSRPYIILVRCIILKQYCKSKDSDPLILLSLQYKIETLYSFILVVHTLQNVNKIITQVNALSLSVDKNKWRNVIVQVLNLPSIKNFGSNCQTTFMLRTTL